MRCYVSCRAGKPIDAVFVADRGVHVLLFQHGVDVDSVYGYTTRMRTDIYTKASSDAQRNLGERRER